MSDDLKQRLRKVEGGNHYGATVWYKNPDGPEAADHIEMLETNFQLQLEWYLSNKRVLDDRIKQLETALRNIAEGDIPRPVWVSYRDDGKPSKYDRCKHDRWFHQECGICIEDYARKTLEGKDD